jgi:gluconolactonase
MEVRVIAEGLEFPEGPVALADGSVLLVEIFAGTLARVSPDGGAAIGPDGKCYVCNNGGFR